MAKKSGCFYFLYIIYTKMDNVLVNLSNSSTSEQNNRGVHKQPIQGLQGGLKVVNYGYDSTSKNIVPLAVDNNGHLDIDVQVADLVMRANDGNDGAGTDRTVKCDANGELQVAVSSTALPTGASTLAEQQTQTTKLTSIDGKITACNTGAVVVSSSALPTGASTEATLSALEAHATDGTQVAQIKANTAKDGTGNSYSPLVDADGHLQVDVLSGAGGGTQFAVGSALGATPTGTLLVGRDGSGNADDVLITNANELRVADTTSQSSLATIAGDTTSLDGKITACNTGAVVVSSSALPTGAATQATLSSIDATTTLLATEATLAQIDADTSALAGCVGGTELQVDIVSSALPTGAATEATLATIDADTSALAGCVGGTELQVDIVSSALPTGAATEATLANISVNSNDLAGCVSGTELQVDIVSSALPTGGSTLAEQQSQTSLLTTIDADTSALAGCVSGTEVQVDVVSTALPSGASTLAEQQSQTSLLTTIDADTSSLAGCVSGTEVQVDVVSSALPSGASTLAEQQSQTSLLTTIDADTSSLAGCVSGTEVQVDVVSSALPSGGATSALQTREQLSTTIFSGTQTITSSASHTFTTVLDKNGSSQFNLLFVSTTSAGSIDYVVDVLVSDDNTTFYYDSNGGGGGGGGGTQPQITGTQNAQIAITNQTSRYAKIIITNISLGSLVITSIKATRIMGI